MDTVADRHVDLVDYAGKGAFREFARCHGATQVARRQAGAAHVCGERNRRDDEERENAKDDKER